MKLQIRAAAQTHTGQVRGNNEDNFYLAGHIREDVSIGETQANWSGKDHHVLVAVADGMGGQARGEQASLITVKHLLPCAFADTVDTALASIRRANETICADIEEHNGSEMGSTLAALYIDAGQALGCNIGDSRIYLLRDRTLSRLSVDHNRAQSMVNFGVLTPEQAAKHPSRHELTQYLGIFEEDMILEPHFSQAISLQPGDCFLLCSDGLMNMVSEEEITAQLAQKASPEEQTANLVRLALEHGGRDNITALVVQVLEQRGPFSWLKGV